MPKVIAYTALLYGADYLAYAIRSVIDYVDEYWVLYSPHGSHGSQTTLPCPDSRRDLYAIAQKAAGNKLRWVDGNWTHEGEQRDSIFDYASGADVIFTVDSDEIYPAGLVAELLAQTSAWHRRFIRVPFVHFYRSFYSAVIHDPAYPVRVIYPHVKAEQHIHTETAQVRPIAHMGYCQRSEVIRYKLHIHGHKKELRCSPDEYVDNYYLNLNRRHDLHPVGSEYWNPEPVNPTDYLPAWMMQHPYAHMELIE